MNDLLKVIIGGVIVGIIVLYIEYTSFTNEPPINNGQIERLRQEREQLRREREKQELLRHEREQKFKSNLLIDE